MSGDVKRRTLVVEYDVTDLTLDQIDYLAQEAVAQGERSDGHPSVPVLGTKIVTQVQGAPPSRDRT